MTAPVDDPGSGVKCRDGATCLCCRADAIAHGVLRDLGLAEPVNTSVVSNETVDLVGDLCTNLLCAREDDV